MTAPGKVPPGYEDLVSPSQLGGGTRVVRGSRPGGVSPGPGPGALAPGRSDLTTAAVGIVVPPPHWIPPPESSPIKVNAFGAGFVAANTPALIPGSAFALPPNTVGIVRTVTLNVNNLTAAIAPTWSLTFGNAPVQGWAQMTMFPRAAATISVGFGPDETFIFVPAGQTIACTFNVLAADPNTYQAGITYTGWYLDKGLWESFARAYETGR